MTSASGEVTEPTWGQLIATLLAGTDLTRAQAAWAMDRVMSGEATGSQLAGFLVALRSKGEVVDELAGLVEVMLKHAVRISVPGPAVDVVGTGGDRHHSVNISTMSALVVAGAGVRVVKHGNRAASSKSGAADVLEALGVRLDLSAERVAELATEVGITFCFAAKFHPSMRFAGPTRAELGVPTVFNFLGPLTNPAQPGAVALGCADLRMAPIMAGVLAARGDRALVFRGEDGLDELSTTGASAIWEVAGGEVHESRFDPADLGFARATLDDLRGGDAAHNAGVVRDLLAGKTGPVRDAVLLNSAAALLVAGADGTGATSSGPDAGPLAARLGPPLEAAAQSIDSGSAAAVLDRWVAAANA
ncbi:anthranilate phosphoribosyltransferase [Spongisporangium articulatum]|uniref:Anthranilate phosphoribosyltransferase n=1 Tax=Spongisporangium articulatum TaxID=3362603 RepID=A0ABW8ASY2_9ACTN